MTSDQPPAAVRFGRFVLDDTSSEVRVVSVSSRLVAALEMANVDLAGRYAHEAGSRWLEAGMPLHHIKEILGHANISQTDTHLNAGRLALHDSMKRFDDLRGKSVAKTPPIDHRLVGHGKSDFAQKNPLH